MKIIEMSIKDYEAVCDLMKQTPGVTIRDADSRESTQRYLERNPGFSFIARDDQDNVIGCAMCGHDGRRGHLQHVMVRPEYRGRGETARVLVVGRTLVRLVPCSGSSEPRALNHTL